MSLKSLEYAKLFSPVFKSEEDLPYKYTCFGEGVSPPLKLESFSNLIRAFALTFGSEKKYYWIVSYIDKSLEIIPENVEENRFLHFGINDFGVKGYTPPCPTKRKLFKFTLYALYEYPTLRGDPTGKELIKSIKDITLSKSFLLCYINP